MQYIDLELSNKEKIAALLSSFGTGIKTPLTHIDPDNYTQHNHRIEDGLKGLKMHLKELPRHTRIRIVRLMEDGEFVFVHTEYNFARPLVGFNVFRFDKGKIVEHWDNLQALQPPNASGRTMTDGPVAIRDRSKTAENKALARRIVEDILVNGHLDKLADYFDGDHYIQHNPYFPDKVSGLTAGLTNWQQEGIVMKYDKIHRVLGEGNFALVISEGYFKGLPSAFYDLFRIENGKIAEHWDTVEEIVPAVGHKNKNAKF